jgi:thiol-disulfide isomerase/thioredoxin
MSKPSIMIFGKQNCAKCKTTKNKVGHYVNRWGLTGEVPVHFIDMDTIEGLTEGAYYDVAKIPTTLVAKPDKPVARWTGAVPNSDWLRDSLAV